MHRRRLSAINKLTLEAIGVGFLLIFLLECFYIITTRGISPVLVSLDIFLSVLVMLGIAFYYMAQRARMERTLRESEEKLRGFIESSTDAFTLWDSKLNLIEANEASLKFHPSGTKMENLIGKNMLDIMPDLKKTETYDRYLEVIKTGRPFFINDVITHPEFGNMHLAVKTFKVGDGLGVITIDVTELKKVEESMNLLSAAVKTSIDAISVTSIGNGKLIFCNDAFLKQWRVEGDFHDLHYTDCFDDNSGILKKSVQSTIKGGWTGEMTAKAMNGQTFPVLVTSSPVLDGNGKTFGLLNIFKDITERKKAEENLCNTLKELEARNKELDEYVYMMSHDLKTPLLNIQGFASLMKKKHGDELDEKTKHYIDTVISGARYLDTLLNDILALSRAGLSKLKSERIELLETVHLSLKSLQTSIAEKGAEVLFPNELPVVYYDPTGLREVFINLLSNALEYSKQGGKPIIEISWNENMNENVILVKDNGIGIEEKYLDKIFQPFERLSSDENGTGLGLSITKKIVERHGGRIWAESKSGEGSAFYFTIPKVTKEVK